MRYLTISCSLNPNSRSRILAQNAHQRLQTTEPEATWLDLTEIELPMCDGAACYQVPAVQQVSRMIAEAQGILVAVPIYNFDVNAAAKNLVELTGEGWEDKVVGFLCAAGAMNSYMSVMSFANSLMFDFRSVIVPRFVYADKSAFTGDTLTEPNIIHRVNELTDTLVRFTTALTR